MNTVEWRYNTISFPENTDTKRTKPIALKAQIYFCHFSLSWFKQWRVGRVAGRLHFISTLRVQ